MIVDKTPQLGGRPMYLDILHGFLVCVSSVVEQRSELSHTMITHICKKNSWLFPLRGQHVWDQRQNHAFNAWITEVLGNNTYKRCLNMSESIFMWILFHETFCTCQVPPRHIIFKDPQTTNFNKKQHSMLKTPALWFLLNHNGCEIGTSGRD